MKIKTLWFVADVSLTQHGGWNVSGKDLLNKWRNSRPDRYGRKNWWWSQQLTRWCMLNQLVIFIDYIYCKFQGLRKQERVMWVMALGCGFPRMGSGEIELRKYHLAQKPDVGSPTFSTAICLDSSHFPAEHEEHVNIWSACSSPPAPNSAWYF